MAGVQQTLELRAASVLALLCSSLCLLSFPALLRSAFPLPVLCSRPSGLPIPGPLALEHDSASELEGSSEGVWPDGLLSQMNKPRFLREDAMSQDTQSTDSAHCSPDPQTVIAKWLCI